MSPASMSDLSSSSMKKGLPSVSVYMASSSSPCARGGTVNTERRRAKIAYIMALTSLRVRGARAHAWANLVAAVGQQDKQGGSSTAPRQVMEKVQAGLVTPMQVLNDQQRRLFGCLAEEEMSQGGEKTTFLVLRIKRGQRGEIRRQREQIKKQGRQRRGQGPHFRVHLFSGRGGQV